MGREAVTQPDEDLNRKGEFVRRTVLALTTMVVAIFASVGVAVAEQITGTSGDNRIVGTNRADQIYGLNGDDDLFGRGDPDGLYGGTGRDEIQGGPGADEIYGGPGIDLLFGGDGRDYINSADNGRPDVINCGGPDGDADTVAADPNDSTDGCNGRDSVQIVQESGPVAASIIGKG